MSKVFAIRHRRRCEPKRFRQRDFGADAGGALVELAVAMPLLALILVGTIDFARIFYTSMQLNSAARAGAQYGAQSVAKSGDIVGMESTALAAAPNIGAFSAAAIRVCQCANADGTSFTTAACNTACGSGHLVVTATVTTSKTFVTLAGSFPGLPNSVDLSRTAALRVPGVN